MTGRLEMTIAGRPVPTAATFDVIDPSTETVFAQAPLATAEQLNAAVSAARTAFTTWSATPYPDRQAAVSAMADIIEANTAELANLVTAETGKPLGGLGSQWEVGGAVAWTRHTASLTLQDEVIQDDAGGRVILTRRPIGVVGSITPWNFPVMIAIWHTMPAILAGNTVVLKPSPNTPVATLRLGRLLQDALPPGVLNVVTGDNAIGQAMSDHPDIDKIVLTGSTATGRQVMRSAASSLKRLTLELGGNDAGIVLPDVDPDAIAEQLFWGIFINNGQTCAALKRLYVHASVYDGICDRLVARAATATMGDGRLPYSQLGTIQNRAQYDRVAGLVEAARADGARILCGGDPGDGPGLFYPVTVVADATEGMAIVDQEQFGPVIPVIRYEDLDDAVRQANNSESGLGGSVWSSDVDAARKVAARLDCGSVWVNAHGAIRPDAPFGGIKQSGIGIEFGSIGLAEYTTIQVRHG